MKSHSMICVCQHVSFLNETMAQWSEEGVEADSSTNPFLLNRQREKGWGRGEIEAVEKKNKVGRIKEERKEKIAKKKQGGWWRKVETGKEETWVKWGMEVFCVRFSHLFSSSRTE